MFVFDRKRFFDGYREQFGALSQAVVVALEALLALVEADTRFSGSATVDRNRLAYCFATFKIETAHTFEPIKERGSDAYFERRYGHLTRVGKMLGNTKPGDGAKYPGYGLVQNTGLRNCTLASKLTGVDLVAHPERQCELPLAYQIAIQGMLDGWFTGKKLADYFRPGIAKWVAARAIINGHDRDAEIAKVAQAFDAIFSFAAA